MASRALVTLFLASLAGVGSCQRLGMAPGAEPEVLAAPPAAGQGEAHRPRLLSGTGSHRHPIATKSAEAQRYFDQGLVLTFGFNHYGAIDAFREAARLDPECAMCFWGVAYAYGPNINAPMGAEGATAAWAALQEARARLPHASASERDYIEALTARYAPDPQPASRGALDAAYAEAMRGVHQRHPEDLDAATLYAEAIMDLHPWDYWTDDGAPRDGTLEAGALLEAVLERDPWHPGANHFLIHVFEEFQPERAEAAADRLAGIAPDAGHLVHMPAHIYWRVGRYQDAWRVNDLAVASDTAYLAWCRPIPFYAAIYYNHNVHFQWAAASAAGQSDVAITAARRLAGGIPREQVANFPPLEDFLTVPVLTLVRFGHFDAALAEPKPPENLRYATAFWHYARGIALARLGRAGEAEAERAAFAAIADDPAWEQVIWVEGPLARRFDVARHYLAGELAASRGDTAAAIPELEAAVSAQDQLNYTEPPAFYFPTRQALGAVLLQANRAADAEAVYRKDLAQYPKNGWSLFGLTQALRAQKKGAETRWAEQGFARAWARSDVKLAASRF
jgi:tetratricopeptide (TPR) repeat protein